MPGAALVLQVVPNPEPAHELESVRSPKRRRLEAQGEQTPSSSSDCTIDVMTEEVARHPKFYLPEGDCIFRIEATLFRVHRFILSRDSSAFEDMFSMPTGNAEPELPKEGYSDNRPIVLEGEVASDFEVLLAVLYALPAELHELTSNPANVSQLLTAAEMANKYHFVTTAAWAISALCDVTECPSEPWRAERAMHVPPESTWASPPILRRLIEVALLCGHKQLCDHAAEKWVELILVRRADPADAMDIADQHGLTRLAGVAYYETLFACNSKLDYVPLPLADDAPLRAHTLTPAQRARLLSGFFALVRRWSVLCVVPPPFARPEGCTYHAHGCLSTWVATWRAATRSEGLVRRPAADVLGRLHAMCELLDADRDLRLALTPACRRAAMESVRALCQQEEDGLAAHFRDLTAPGEAEASTLSDG